MPAPIINLVVGGAVRAVAKRVAPNAVKSVATKKLVKQAAKKKSVTAVRQRIDTDAIAGNSVKVKPSAETKAKLSKARQEEYLKRSSKPRILKTPVKKVSQKKINEHYRAMYKQWND